MEPFFAASGLEKRTVARAGGDALRQHGHVPVQCLYYKTCMCNMQSNVRLWLRPGKAVHGGVRRRLTKGEYSSTFTPALFVFMV
eukprot:scaffold82898_cov54-Phaeocystis_antarctica.AAC.4